MVLRIAVALTVLAVLAAGCTAPTESAAKPSAPAPSGEAQASGTDDVVRPESVSGSPGSVGGSVRNSPPTSESFAPSATTGENRGGFVVVFTGAFKDKNAEAQIANLSVTGVGPATVGASHAVTSAETKAETEPAAFGADGFKVWTGTKNDGVLLYKFQQAFPAFTAVGVYDFRAYAFDAPGASGVSESVLVTLTAFSDITIGPTPVSAAGEPLPGQNWGQWEAEAGAANVEATNYLKLVNTGDTPDARVVVDFAGQFVGADDPSFAIGTAGNVQFAWFEDASPAATAPSEGAYSFAAANADAAVTVQFSGRGNVIYLTYRIAALPDVLPVQSYGIAFTVTEL